MPRSKSKRQRYQPPPRKKPKPSPKWFGGLILGLLLAGVVVILGYYGLVPGFPWAGDQPGANPALLFIGLGLIAVGFGAATQWR
ncbi:MAG TPA: cell division protein CrgA [Actinomycetota bacterium]|nr:cell division protein CrgA [Actinomycetota bacterium]